MQLSTNFSLEELVASDTAARSGIDNTPDADTLGRLRLLARALESVREVLDGKPIHVNSGYRSLALNAKVGSKSTSAHVSGLAADIVCPSFGRPIDVCRAIRDSQIPFDQVILEFYDPPKSGGWCHFAIAHAGLVGRRECLTIDKNGARMGLEG